MASVYCAASGITYGNRNDSQNQIVLKSLLNISSPIYGSMKDLETVFRSLLENAREALKIKGDIYLSAHEEPGMIHVYVQENGCGIPEEPFTVHGIDICDHV